MSFNPCFSGRYSAILGKETLVEEQSVSILVLVEGILQFLKVETGRSGQDRVSILVLVEGILQSLKRYGAALYGSFNPCFSGRYSAIT